ncbi:Phospholipase/Carboxylesterase-domain-containing protein [Melanogaster broomeanus]|nr:Phospholipase/Carboxylesterase-domain-containing protein [Melanogaster broomeanus]
MAARVSSLLRPFEVVKPLENHTATVIFLHGLGDSGKGWLDIIKELKVQLPHVKWLLPNAPNRSITANMGFGMSGWFDLRSWDLEDKNEDRLGVLESARTIDQHIQDEVDAGILPGRIVLGGFSQGGAMSLLTALTARGEEGVAGGKGGWKLGGVAILSGWMLLKDDFSKVGMSTDFSAIDHYTSAHVSWHGDNVVPYIVAQKAANMLTNQFNVPALENLTLSMQLPASGYSPEEGKMGTAGLSFRSYRSEGHEACERTLEDLKEFLKRVLPK